MKSFNKATCKQLRADLQAVLNKYGATEGIEFNIGNMRFYEHEVKFTGMTATIKGEKKLVEKALDHQFAIHGLQDVNAKGDRLIEYNRRRYQYPFIYIEARSGKRYKCSLAQCLRLGFGATTPAAI